MNTGHERTDAFGSPETEHYDFENSSSGSSCSSCCEYSDDSIPEWNKAVQENGDLFFIKCSPLIQGISINHERPSSKVNRSNRFSAFLRKRKPKKHKKPVDVSVLDKEVVNTSSPKILSPRVRNEFEDLFEHSIAVLFLNLACIDRSDSSTNDTHYYFPQSAEKNVVNLIKGALITLYHLLPKLISEEPESSTIFIKEELVHIVYVGEGKDLMILACPESRCSLFELKQLSSSISHCLNFKYGSLHDCFINPINQAHLNQFFGNLFIKLLRCTGASNLIVSEKYQPEVKEGKRQAQFEETFVFPCLLTIPQNLKTKIHEKLNEIESNDFGDLSEDHYGCQRLFTIIGTCLYYKGCLIVSHLQPNDLVNINSFLRLNDILDLTVTSIMESLIVWQEVYSFSYLHNPEATRFRLSNRRWFLLVIGKDQGLLVTLLETGGCSVSNTGPCHPDELYVEQIQDTLSDILHLGLSEVVEQCIKSRTNSASPQKSTPRKSSENSLNSLSNYGTLKRSSEYSSSSICDSETNISHRTSFTPTNGHPEDTFSESPSRTNSSTLCDDTLPVLGRRAQRLQQLSSASSASIYTLSQSNLSDSDHSDYDTTGSSHSSLFAENKKPKSIISSKTIIHDDAKALFYYVNLHANRGVILYSVNAFNSDNASNASSTQRLRSIINNFKLSAQKIHTVLAQKKTSNVGKFQRNSLPVKEYGLLFECHHTSDEEDKKSVSTSYWVVGRMFNKPQLGEVYVCYEDKAPQNLVEVAFRLAMTS